jgi:NAD(P)H-hydrate repair Nnr-like enzyme with NAD(P)H-hydrate dehydratase domain
MNNDRESDALKPYVTQIADIAKLIPARVNSRNINKGTYGHVVVFAGSKDVAGAPVMVADAAMRTGAGLVTLTVPESIKIPVMSHVSSVVMTRTLPENAEGNFGNNSSDVLLSLIRKATSVAVGPGIGLGAETFFFLKEIIEN